MASTIKPLYAAAAPITITIVSLGNGSSRQSTVVDNSTNLYDDAMVSLLLKPGTVTAPSVVNLYTYCLGGDDATYTDACTGSDAAYTILSPTNLRLIAIISLPTNSTQEMSAEYSVAQAFGGNLPKKWGIVITNSTGAALDGSVGSAYYRGVQYQIV